MRTDKLNEALRIVGDLRLLIQRNDFAGQNESAFGAAHGLTDQLKKIDPGLTAFADDFWDAARLFYSARGWKQVVGGSQELLAQMHGSLKKLEKKMRKLGAALGGKPP